MSNKRTEQIKKLLISAQQSNSPKEQLLNDVAEGKIRLLSAKDIYQRLNLSEDEFTNLVRNNDPTYSPTQQSRIDDLTDILNRQVFEARKNIIKLDNRHQYSFPAPDLYIVGKARWTEDTLKQWLLQGAK
ncbi:hypothetical protein [Haemophilus parahaemolyticus]|uniref:Uncharacterized protein n=2 Tax=Haemophilus parahaemolyticus TaxID=735 RepID=A0AAE6MPV5_HAEPH|nr:hypothetical protein [Haemophilus parahaemolyticus]EIJ72898.1 hypothetical protein HMPREF1050_0051 [Haemophilus parahaemolyticus HK385]OOR97522.1 hypothetical protein B0185_01575 [Haemophilus parahaemolyticus]QEN11701.1 hypothetical protein E5Q53_09855 [Haemophilus parahaemolyticus]QRP12900.1 hypothetical protein I6J29_01650 [Haemophilus parahaemolyticus]STO66268.1 Uncharacterised protein [Haemophilus parahaemolyticus HK385]